MNRSPGVRGLDANLSMNPMLEVPMANEADVMLFFHIFSIFFPCFSWNVRGFHEPVSHRLQEHASRSGDARVQSGPLEAISTIQGICTPALAEA